MRSRGIMSPLIMHGSAGVRNVRAERGKAGGDWKKQGFIACHAGELSLAQ